MNWSGKCHVTKLVLASILAGGCLNAELDNFAARPVSSKVESTISASGMFSSGTGAAAAVGTTGVAGSPSELLVDDFEDGDTLASNGFGWWYSQNDTAGDQDFRIGELSDRAESTRAANSSGIGFDVWGALVGLDMTPGSGLYDASAFTQLRFWARAAPDTVTSLSARLLEGGETQFETPIELGTEWRQYILRFDALSAVDGSDRLIDSSRIAALQIFVFSDQRFNFWIDDVVFVNAP